MVAISGVLFLLSPMLPFMKNLDLQQTLAVCTVIGVALSAQSPAVVMAMLAETRAEGPLSQVLLASVVVADLVVITLFSVAYDPVAAAFHLSARLAGAIDPSKAGLYVIGVNTGTGPIRPFASIGEGNVIFNQAIVIRKTGIGAVSGHALLATIAGDQFSVIVPLAFLPSTGFAPKNYGFNLWPRNGTGKNSQISDFAPENRNLASVPEPATWAMMLAGFGLAGGALRLRRMRRHAPA